MPYRESDVNGIRKPICRQIRDGFLSWERESYQLFPISLKMLSQTEGFARYALHVVPHA
jgi:hypothetical protein